MSAFDDLMNLGEPASQTGGFGADPFDPYSGGAPSGGNLLDFDGLGLTDSSSSAVSFAANTNPLYEFTNSLSKMSADTSDQLLDFMGETPATQKDLKQEPSNPLYDFMNSDENVEQTNGHADDLLNGLSENENQNANEEGNDNNDFDTRNSEMLETRNTEMFETRNTEMFETRNMEMMEEVEEEDAQNEEVDAEKVADESGPFWSDDSGVTVDIKETEEQPRATTPEPEEDHDRMDSRVEEEVIEQEEELEVAANGPVDVEEGPEGERTNVEESSENVEGTIDAPEEEADALEHQAEEELTKVDENQAEVAEEITEKEENIEEVSGTVAEEKEDVEDEKHEMEKETEENVKDEVIEEQIPFEFEKPVEGVEEPETQNEAIENAENNEESPDASVEPEVVEEVQEVEEEKIAAELEIVAETQREEQEIEDRADGQAVEEEQVQDANDYEKPASLDISAEEAPSSPGLTEPTETRQFEEDENALKMNGTSEVRENGAEEDDTVHFAEMNNVRQKFESGNARSEEPAPRAAVSVRHEFDQGGEFENEPVRNPDVIRESDHATEELPEVGTAKNLVNRFKSIQEEQAKPVASGKRVSPPRAAEKVEYESQPTARMEQYQGQSEAGEFESQPKEIGEVVRSGDVAEDYQPEKGYAKNIMNKFKEIQSESSQYKSPSKREITPDRSGKVEYVSEPRGQRIEYEETHTDSGVFENVPKTEEDVIKSGDKVEEPLPEQGMAKNLLSKFKQMEASSGYKPPPSPKREITPDRSGKVEYVSEPKGYLEKYEPPVESGEFENKPVSHPEVVRSGEAVEEVLPEVGSAKKTLERFKEIQKQSTSPVSSKSKEFTPPRETSPGKTVAGVVENTPQFRPDVVRSGDAVQEELPQQGTARNILNRFKDIQANGSQSTSPGRKQKEFTPPPESGVYENTPQKHLEVETRQSESGIIQNTPSKSTADVARERESASPESELPEQGLAKNLVSKWKQLESSSASAKSTASASPKFKEFTPPRDSRGPMSPKSPAGGASNSVHPSQLPGQYQPIEAPGLYENEPENKPDVFREADTDWEAGMPAKNTTASMLEKFKSIQQKAAEDSQSPVPVTRKDKAMFRVAQTEKCSACEKTVYAMEKLEMNGLVYHKNCFKCSHCSARLTPKTFSMNEGVIYCVNHFKQLFARKGNYDEGFGRQQYKKVWEEKKKEDTTA